MKFDKKSNSQVLRRKSQLVSRLIFSLLIVISVFLLVFFVTKAIIKNINSVPTISKIYEAWDESKYQDVVDLSDKILNSSPFNSTVLAYKGYSLFSIAISQTDLDIALNYIDQSINSLRLALLNSPEALIGQINYMLGKAYFHKNSLSTYYYYADCVVYYLQEAINLGFSAPDIPRYLGLSYAQLSMTEESIKAFSEALMVDENDELLLAIAEQYINNEQSGNAKQYLFRIRSTSNDDVMILKACENLASIYTEEENYVDALAEYNSILEKDPNNADACYGIGVVYEKMGDMVKARAEWRKALKIQVNHPGALKKLR
jgi:tetratricopeptide (TPR) repeat protein